MRDVESVRGDVDGGAGGRGEGVARDVCRGEVAADQGVVEASEVAAGEVQPRHRVGEVEEGLQQSFSVGPSYNHILEVELLKHGGEAECHGIWIFNVGLKYCKVLQIVSN